MTCKAGLASIFFVDETCWISAFMALISFSEKGIIDWSALVEAVHDLKGTQRERENLRGMLHVASTSKTGA